MVVFDAYGQVSDLDDAENNWKVGGDLYYKLGGITYNFNPEYGISGGASYFAFTPKATIVW